MFSPMRGAHGASGKRRFSRFVLDWTFSKDHSPGSEGKSSNGCSNPPSKGIQTASNFQNRSNSAASITSQSCYLCLNLSESPSARCFERCRSGHRSIGSRPSGAWCPPTPPSSPCMRSKVSSEPILSPHTDAIYRAFTDVSEGIGSKFGLL